MTTMIAPSVSAGNGNSGIVPPWLQDPVFPLPDPVGDVPRILPIDDDEWQHRTFVLNRLGEVEFRCDEAFVPALRPTEDIDGGDHRSG